MKKTTPSWLDLFQYVSKRGDRLALIYQNKNFFDIHFGNYSNMYEEIICLQTASIG
jgi:hypothetical protein